MAEFLEQALSLQVYRLPRKEWPTWLRKREANYRREMERVKEVEVGILGTVAEAMLGLIGPAGRILAKQIKQGKIDKPRSWTEVDQKAAEEIIEATKAEVWDRLADTHPAYGVVSLGLAKLAESNKKKDLVNLERLFVWAGWELYKAGLPTILVFVDDWCTNADGKRRLQVEPDIVVGLPDHDLGLEVRLVSLMKSLKEDYPKNKWQPRRFLLNWKFGIGFQELSATSGINLPKGMMQALNLQKNLPAVEAVWRLAGVENEGEAVDYLNAFTAAHELAHGVLVLDALLQELGPDALAARKCLEMVVQKGEGWEEMEQKKMILTILGECVSLAKEERTGYANNDGYSYSGRRIVNLMFKTGVVEISGNELEVNLARLAEFMVGLGKVETWLTTKNGKKKIGVLGRRLSTGTKILMDAV